MESSLHDQMINTDFLRLSAKRLAILAIVVLLPFSINSIFQQRLIVGIGSLAIVLLLAFNAWSLNKGRNTHNLTFYVLVPGIIFFMALTFKQQGIVGALWCYPAAISFYAMLPEPRAWIANVVLIAVVVLCSWLYLEPALAIRVVATLLAVSAFTAIFTHVIYGQHEKLKSLVVTDPLTGLFNRILLQDSLEEAIAQSQRGGVPATVVAVDIDHFKSINDSYGHDTGDKALVEIGKLMKESFRKSDKVFRLGGEEFLVLLYNTDREAGWQVAEQLRGKIAAQALIEGHTVTASLGVAELEPDMNWGQWLKRADEFLYKAKAEGRNCTKDAAVNDPEQSPALSNL